MYEPEQAARMLTTVHKVLWGEGEPGTTIQGLRCVLRVCARSSPRDGNRTVGTDGQVRLHDARGVRHEDKFSRSEPPVCPELTLPAPFGVLPVADDEVLLGVVWKERRERLEQNPNAGLQKSLLHVLVRVREVLGPVGDHSHCVLARVRFRQEPVWRLPLLCKGLNSRGDAFIEALSLPCFSSRYSLVS